MTLTTKINDETADWLTLTAEGVGLTVEQLTLCGIECLRQYVDNIGGGALVLPVNLREAMQVRGTLDSVSG